MVKDDSTERQEPKQPPEKLRFLGHSLTAFGHDSAASVTGSIKGRGGMKCEKRLKGCRFSIGSAPLTSITKSDAQISGGETRQDYKDPRRFPLVDLTFDQTTSPGGFFVFRARDYAQKKMISRRSFL
ncbi:hypothetical protein BHU60_28600 [Klebsiella pneumoniae]|nr:hypothetical protein BHU60_28600 [Klebsiella pneumoniae]